MITKRLEKLEGQIAKPVDPEYDPGFAEFYEEFVKKIDSLTKEEYQYFEIWICYCCSQDEDVEKFRKENSLEKYVDFVKSMPRKKQKKYLEDKRIDLENIPDKDEFSKAIDWIDNTAKDRLMK